jgi:putative flavoprotein involved in K+ transport
MNGIDGKRHWSTIVIGGGQAGLAGGYYLAGRGQDFVILDAGARVGDAWRARWDSLCLFTPSQHDGLPGMPFPAPRGTFPTKDQAADYLSEYARRFALPLRLGVRATGLSRTTTGYEVTTSAGKLTSDRVIVATGTNPTPGIPAFAGELDSTIVQVHSSGYRNPASLPPGAALVVGAGTSGVEIAIELARNRHTYLAGHPTSHIPDPIFRYAGEIYWWFISTILTNRTPVGRKARKSLSKKGGPLIRVSLADAIAAGVEHVPRVAGVSDGKPRLEDGRLIDVSLIVWATGFKPDFSWIELDVTDEQGWPRTQNGISTAAPGLYFLGMPFQFGLTSGLIGGVGRDAAFIVNHLSASNAKPNNRRLPV